MKNYCFSACEALEPTLYKRWPIAKMLVQLSCTAQCWPCESWTSFLVTGVSKKNSTLDTRLSSINICPKMMQWNFQISVWKSFKVKISIQHENGIGSNVNRLRRAAASGHTELEPIYLLFGVRSSLHIDCRSKISSHDADAAKYRSVCCCSLKADTWECPFDSLTLVQFSGMLRVIKYAQVKTYARYFQNS